MRTQRILASVAVVALVTGLAPVAAAQQTGASTPPPASHGSGVRLGLQARIDALNVFGVETLDPDSRLGIFVPIVTPGVRLVDNRLFLGLGLGFYGASRSECENPACDAETTTSTSGWALSPLASFDLLMDAVAALSLVGWLNFGNFNSASITRDDPGGSTTTEIDGEFWWGLNLGAGLRGKLSEGLAIGGEFGWGFAMTSWEDPGGEDNSIFLHGVFGTILFEASVGI